MNYLKYILELFSAWRRSERRIAPMGARGRVYERKSGDTSGPSKIQATTKVMGTLSAKVIRADGRVEDLGVIGTVERN